MDKREREDEGDRIAMFRGFQFYFIFFAFWLWILFDFGLLVVADLHGCR